MHVVQENVVPWWLRQKRICLQCRRHRFDPWVEKCPWRRKRQPTPVFLPGESLGQRSLMGYNPWGPKESPMTEQLKLSLFTGKQWGKKGHVTSVMTWHMGTYSVCRRVHTDASMCACMLSCSVVSDSFQLHGLQPSGSSAHGASQAGALERAAVSSSTGSSRPRGRPSLPQLPRCRHILYHWTSS